MCEYCDSNIFNKLIKDIDNDNKDKARIIITGSIKVLRVELDGVDPDGYKTHDFFPINYCPMCGRKLGE